MYRKAVCFGDDKVAAQILATEDVAEIKALGRLVSGYDESLWNGIRQIVVYEGIFAKFSQNPELREQLKDTGKAFLAECAVKDRIWGIGLSMRDPARLDRAKWQGQNLLGYGRIRLSGARPLMRALHFCVHWIASLMKLRYSSCGARVFAGRSRMSIPREIAQRDR